MWNALDASFQLTLRNWSPFENGQEALSPLQWKENAATPPPALMPDRLNFPIGEEAPT
jgi:hypothetical protein